MEMSEKKFYKYLVDHLPGHVQRIECQSMPGVPDLNACYDGKEVWIETKMTTPHGVLLRKEQYAWGMRRAKSAGLVYVIALDDYLGRIHIWQYPHMVVKPYGKYLKIMDPSHGTFQKPLVVGGLARFLF